MRYKIIVGVSLLAILIALVLILRKDDGMSQMQRDIDESLERARTLKAERDSLAEIIDVKKFPKHAQVAASDTVEGDKIVADAVEKNEPQPAIQVSAPPVQLPPAIAQSDIAQVTNSSEGEASIPENRFYTTDKMEGLVPNTKKMQFSAGDIVYIYAGVHAPKSEQVRIDWIDPSGDALIPSEYVNVESNTGTNGYRIYKQRKFQKAGKYGVRLYDGGGKMIGRTEFEVVE